MTCLSLTTIWRPPGSIAGSFERVDGFRVAGVAHTGAQALSSDRELRPHLILLEVYVADMMAGVLQRLRSEGDGVGVIIITAARERLPCAAHWTATRQTT